LTELFLKINVAPFFGPLCIYKTRKQTQVQRCCVSMQKYNTILFHQENSQSSSYGSAARKHCMPSITWISQLAAAANYGHFGPWTLRH